MKLLSGSAVEFDGGSTKYGLAAKSTGQLVFFSALNENTVVVPFYRLVINSDGKVGIGTDSPTELLSVNGNIKSKKVIVTQTGWADFVFADDYRLLPLAEVEKFIKQHRRLPDIPSQNEVDEKGIDVGEVQARLLQKIEELTLYVIELERKLSAQQEELENLKVGIK
jgi:hypothetical protein